MRNTGGLLFVIFFFMYFTLRKVLPSFTVFFFGPQDILRIKNLREINVAIIADISKQDTVSIDSWKKMYSYICLSS